MQVVDQAGDFLQSFPCKLVVFLAHVFSDVAAIYSILKMVPALHQTRASHLDEPGEVHGVKATEALGDLAWSGC